MKQEIKSLENKVIKEIDLDKTIFGVEVKNEIIHRMVRYQLAKKDLVTTKPKVYLKYQEPLENLLSKREQVVLVRVVEDLHK